MQWLEDTSGQNFHANHHLVHTKNYGIYNSLLDMYFTTATHNTQYRCPVYCVLYCIMITPSTGSSPASTARGRRISCSRWRRKWRRRTSASSSPPSPSHLNIYRISTHQLGVVTHSPAACMLSVTP